MLPIVVPPSPPSELWDEAAGVFVPIPGFKGASLRLEHSLISVRKWESKWHKSYLSTKEKTVEEFLDYIRCMTLNEVDSEVYRHLTEENIKEIAEYIQNPMTATTIKRKPGKGPSRKIITSEIIESWMIDAEIPFDPCEKWHLNRLLMLINVRNEQANPGKKMSPKNIMKNNAALNAQRRAKAHSKG